MSKDLIDSRSLFGPIQNLLDDPSVSEVMINGAKKVFVESKGLIKKTPISFASETDVLHLAQQLARSLGKELNAENPYCDGRVGENIRIHCTIPPISPDGTSLTIRKQNRTFFDPQTLIERGFWDERVAFFLSACVQARLNIIVSGGTGMYLKALFDGISEIPIVPEEVKNKNRDLIKEIGNDEFYNLLAAKDPEIKNFTRLHSFY